MKLSLTLTDILEAAPTWPTGQPCQLVTLEYRTPDGYTYTTHLRIERRADRSLALACPWCGQHCTALYHDPSGRGLRCEYHGKRKPDLHLLDKQKPAAKRGSKRTPNRKAA